MVEEEEEEEEGGFIRLDSGSWYPDPEDALIGVDKEHAISALAMKSVQKVRRLKRKISRFRAIGSYKLQSSTCISCTSCCDLLYVGALRVPSLNSRGIRGIRVRYVDAIIEERSGSDVTRRAPVEWSIRVLFGCFFINC